MTSYCTLQGAKRQLAVQINVQTGLPYTVDDATVASFIDVCSAAIDDYTGNWFNARVDTFGFDAAVGRYNPLLMLKDYPLLEITTLLNGNGDTIASANYTLLPVSQYPKQQVRLNVGNYWRGPNDPSNTSNNCAPSNSLLNRAYAYGAIQITGFWGYHRNYLRAWKRITPVLNTNIDTDDTSLTLNGIVGLNFDVGSVIRFTTNDVTEQMLVTGAIANSLSTGFNSATFTVERGYNNTTPIAHITTSTIDVWQMESVIEKATEMAVAAWYKGRDNATGDALIIPEIGQLSIPQDLPVKIKNILVPYRSHWRGRP